MSSEADASTKTPTQAKRSTGSKSTGAPQPNSPGTDKEESTPPALQISLPYAGRTASDVLSPLKRRHLRAIAREAKGLVRLIDRIAWEVPDEDLPIRHLGLLEAAEMLVSRLADPRLNETL